jgi:hypothetical protein
MSEATLLVLCSRSAHDQNVLARRAQWDQQGWSHSGIVVDKKKEETCAGEDQSRPLLRRGKTSKLGRSIIRRIKTRGIDTKTGVMFADSGSIACY